MGSKCDYAVLQHIGQWNTIPLELQQRIIQHMLAEFWPANRSRNTTSETHRQLACFLDGFRSAANLSAVIIYPLAEFRAAWTLEREKHRAKLPDLYKRTASRQAFAGFYAFAIHLAECANLIAHAQWLAGDESAKQGLELQSRRNVSTYLVKDEEKQVREAKQAKEQERLGKERAEKLKNRTKLRPAAKVDWAKAKLEFDQKEEKRLQPFVDSHVVF